MIPKGCVRAAPPRVKGLDTTLEVELLLLAVRRELRVQLPSGWRSNNGKKQGIASPADHRNFVTIEL